MRKTVETSHDCPKWTINAVHVKYWEELVRFGTTNHCDKIVINSNFQCSL